MSESEAKKKTNVRIVLEEDDEFEEFEECDWPKSKQELGQSAKLKNETPQWQDDWDVDEADDDFCNQLRKELTK